MKNKITILLVFLLLIGIFALFFYLNYQYQPISADSINSNYIKPKKDMSNNLAEIKKITLSFNDGYYPDTIRIKQGIPVELVLDESVSGCYRNFIVDKLGISEYSSNPSIPIEFTADKKGRFTFTCCSMDMATGTLIVE